MDFRPQRLARRQGRIKKASHALCFFVSALLLAGAVSSFLVPQSRMKSFTIESRLFGYSQAGDVPGRPISRQLVFDALGVGEDDYCMFTSAAKVEESLSSAWFVSPSPAPKVEIGPFSCRIWFTDLYPLARDQNGEIFLSSGDGYRDVEQMATFYPEDSLAGLPQVPEGECAGYDYGDWNSFRETLVGANRIDPELLTSGRLKYFTRDGSSYYLYLDFDGLGFRLETAGPDIEKLDYQNMIIPTVQALRHSLAGEEHSAVQGKIDAFTGRSWYRLSFGTGEGTNDRYGVFWADEEEEG